MLSDNILPVPKYFWKILYSPENNEAIVFISLNNPFVDKLNDNDIFCENICDKYSWNKTRWNDLSSGFLFCCNYKDFNNVVETSPKLNVNNVMKQIKK